MQKRTKWRVKSPNPALQEILSTELNVSPILAQLLINRGIYTLDQARFFLGSELDTLFSPWLMKDMDKAVQRILAAKNRKESILVYGDYDVDGITGTTVLVLALRKIGCTVDYFIPHRLEEGYGLNQEALERAAAQGVSLVITVDCGISGYQEVARAKDLHLDVVVTDHHEPPLLLPEAVAVVDPKQADCGYPFKELAGVGVALKLVQGLYQQAGIGPKEWEEYLDLVCLGTVADIVPLQGENRIIVKHGLPRMVGNNRPGLQALIKISGIKAETLGTRELGFGLAPRLNAAGRMGDAALGVELLLAGDVHEAEKMAEALNKGNQERQQVEAKVLAQALEMVEADPELAQDKVLVLASANWHPGVIGIVASRLADRFYRPVFMISLEDGKGKGSARSIPGFNLYQAMVSCQDFLEQFGGHAMAAGFSIDEDKIADFRSRMNQAAQEALTEERLTPNLDLDALVNLAQLSMDTVQELDQLSPFGHCNPGPVLGCCEARVVQCREVGKNGGHLKMRVREDQVVLDGIGFNLASYSEMLATHDQVDMAFVPSINVWNGRSSVQLEVKEFKEVGEVTLAHELPVEPRGMEELLGRSLDLPREKLLNSPVPVGFFEFFNHREQEAFQVSRGEVSGREMVDFRDGPDRVALLGRVLAGAESSLILVESTSEVFQIAALLGAEEGFRSQMAVYYPELAGSLISDLEHHLQQNRVKILVSTGFSPLNHKAMDFEQVIFFHLPYSRREFYTGLQAGKKAVLLGGEAQVGAAGEKIKALAPDRQGLGEWFKLLRNQCDRSGEGKAGILELCRFMRKQYPGAAGWTVDLVFTVFQELGLMEYRKQENDYYFRVHAGVRTELQKSPTYNWSLHTREACLKFQQEYIAATPEQLLRSRG
ncbi:single-stranded-DNA-specific exonuclease RecJ [Desulforamulus ruminis]|uniref:single-stranded-DNA-specific exonuclease RecJ n=1 Tax=Desulforamulus ruminis TaxID=1564 RepID=UPI0023567B6C|nr:single-stranded-DNA-specific exonuclease RecJ [Desulforamulus ruminis]